MHLSDLRRLCAIHCNPIGIPMANIATKEEIGYRPLPEDEYDTYMPRFIHLINSGAENQEIISYLEEIEREYLGLSTPAGRKESFIEAVREAMNIDK